MEFFLYMEPPTVTAQQKGVQVKNGKPFFYTKPAVQAEHDELCLLLGRWRPAEPFPGAVRLTVQWQFARGRRRNGAWKTTKPDTDNLQKLLKDCMTETGYWLDDAQVASEHIMKIWSDQPGILIRVEEL